MWGDDYKKEPEDGYVDYVTDAAYALTAVLIAAAVAYILWRVW